MEKDREREIIDGGVRILKAHLDPDQVWLFGSRAKGQAASGADFDFAVDLPRPDRTIEAKLSVDFEALLGLYEADIIYLQEVDSKFRDLVLNTGKIIYDKART